MSNSYRSLYCCVGSLLLTAMIGPVLFAATITLPADRDNMILATTFVQSGQQLNDVNLGGANLTQVGTAGGTGAANEVRIISSFDATAMPAHGTVNSVTLRLFYLTAASDIAGNTPFTIDVHSISTANANWVEGTGLGTGGAPDNSGSNWNYKSEPGLLTWAGAPGLQTPGVDYDATLLASQTFNTLPADGTPIDFVFTGSSAQLTSLIDGWATTNPGFVLFNDNVAALGGNKRMFFSSREATDSLLHPQLIVDFELPVPEPSTFALLGLGAIGLAIRTRRRRTAA